MQPEYGQMSEDVCSGKVISFWLNFAEPCFFKTQIYERQLKHLPNRARFTNIQEISIKWRE